MTRSELHATVVLVCGQTEVVTWPLTGEGRPDLSAVDALARLQLAAKRMGCSIVLREAHAELCDLLELAGLADLLTAEPSAQDPRHRQPLRRNQ